MEEKEMVKGFFFMRQYYETFRMLPDAERLALLDALLAYAFESAEPDEACPILIRVALNGMKTTINGSIKMQQARSEAGKRGGAPKGNRNACKDETSKNNIIDARYNARLPLIITTNLPLKEITESEDIDKRRVYSRILEICTPIKFHSPDLRRKIGIQKTESYKSFFIE